MTPAFPLRTCIRGRRGLTVACQSDSDSFCSPAAPGNKRADCIWWLEMLLMRHLLADSEGTTLLLITSTVLVCSREHDGVTVTQRAQSEQSFYYVHLLFHHCDMSKCHLLYEAKGFGTRGGSRAVAEGRDTRASSLRREDWLQQA